MAKPISKQRPGSGASTAKGGHRAGSAKSAVKRPRPVSSDPWERSADTVSPVTETTTVRRAPAGPRPSRAGAAAPAGKPRSGTTMARNTGPWKPAARPKTGPRPAKPGTAAAGPKAKPAVSASGLKAKPKSPAQAGERLQKILAAAGVASRRACEAIILEGRVQVNGVTVTELGTRADPRRDQITLDFQPITREQPVYILLNKPKGYVTSVKDDEGRPTVMALLHGVEARVYPVGRLDFNSEGLLLMTNDGEMAQRLMAPEFHVAKVYLVKIHRMPKPETLDEFRGGFRLDGQRLKPCAIEVAEKADNPWLKVTLVEGKNQQIRRMFAAVGHPVSKLRRIQFGPLDDPALKPGEWRFLNPQELAALKAL
jgi:23S rRNA pseudouridine2605 synthase